MFKTRKNEDYIPAIALTNVQVASSEVAMLALTTEEGDVVVRTDESKSYMRNSGGSGTMSDYTELLSPLAPVSSVNSKVGVVVLDTGDVASVTDSRYVTDADLVNLSNFDTLALKANVEPAKTIIVDSGATEIVGKVYTTWSAADTWLVANESVSKTNIWQIKIRGLNAENIVVREWINISGEDNTQLTGNITSAGFNVSILDAFKIQNCSISNLTIGATSVLWLTNCRISGGACSSAMTFFENCIITNGTFTSASGGTFSMNSTWFPMDSGSITLDSETLALSSWMSGCVITGGSFKSSFISSCTFSLTNQDLYFDSCVVESTIDTSGSTGSMSVYLKSCSISSTVTLKAGNTLYTSGGTSGLVVVENGGTWNKENIKADGVSADGNITLSGGSGDFISRDGTTGLTTSETAIAGLVVKNGIITAITSGASNVQPDHIITVDANAQIIAGKTYTTWAAADAWITANETPSSSNIWCIKIHGTNAENIVVRPWVTISGVESTILTGNVTSAGYDLSNLSAYKIEKVQLNNLTVGATSALWVQNANITGGTISSLFTILDMCGINGADFTASNFTYLFRSSALSGSFDNSLLALSSYFANITFGGGDIICSQIDNNNVFLPTGGTIKVHSSFINQNSIDISGASGVVNLVFRSCIYDDPTVTVKLKAGSSLTTTGEIYGLSVDENGGTWQDLNKRKSTKRLINTDSPYTVLESDEVIFADTDAGNITINLPAGVEGRHFKIVSCGSSANDVILDPNGTEQIWNNGAGVSVTLADGDILDLHFNTTEGWW